MSEESTQPGSGYPRARATSSPATEPDADARWRLAAVRRVAASALPAKLRLALVCGYLPVVRVGDGAVWCGPEHVAAATGLSLRTCKSIPQELVALGVLVAYPDCERPAGQRRTAAYRLDLDALAAEPPRRTRPARRSDASATGTASKPGVQDLHSCAQPTVQELHTYEVPRAFGSSANPALLAHDETDALASWGAAPAPNRSIEEDLKKEEILLIPRASVREDEADGLFKYHPSTPPEDEPDEADAPAPTKKKPVDLAVETVWVAYCRISAEFEQQHQPPSADPDKPKKPTNPRRIPNDVRKAMLRQLTEARANAGSWPVAIAAVIDMIEAHHFAPSCAWWQGAKDGVVKLDPIKLFRQSEWSAKMTASERWVAEGKPRATERQDPTAVRLADTGWDWVWRNHPAHADRPDHLIERFKDQRGAEALLCGLDAIGGWSASKRIHERDKPARKRDFITAFIASYNEQGLTP